MDDYGSSPIGAIVDVVPQQSTLDNLGRNGFTHIATLPGNVWRFQRHLNHLLTREEQYAQLEAMPLYHAQNAYLRSIGLLN